MVQMMRVSQSRLAWEARYEGGAQNKVWNTLPQLLQKLYGVFLRRSVHAEQCHIADVLQGDVDVLAHLHRQKVELLGH